MAIRVAKSNILSHTASEALQSIELVVGDKQLPDFLRPFVSTRDASSAMRQVSSALQTKIDINIVEISYDRQFIFDGISLHSDLISRNFVQPRRKALLRWFRDLCNGVVIDDDCIEVALDDLRRDGFECDSQTDRFLRGLRLDHQSEEEISDILTATMAKTGGRWIVVGHFVIPDTLGAVMADRRALNAKLRGAAGSCDAGFYDPSDLVERYGRAIALDGDGADIFEYAPSFNATVGETLVDLARQGTRSVRRGVSVNTTPTEASAAASPASRSEWAQRVDAELVGLHRDRLKRLGLEASGLSAYHAARLERGSFVGAEEWSAFKLIEAELPAYERYGVMRAVYGQLALLLAASGREVLAYEPKPSNRAVMEAGRDHLLAVGLLAPGALTLFGSMTPKGGLSEETLGIGLNLFHVPPHVVTAQLPRLAAFKGLLLNNRGFKASLETESVEPLSARVAQIGFHMAKDFELEGLSWFCRSRG